MTEAKENLVSIKVATSLVKKLKSIQHEYVERDEKEPTYSALLLDAWERSGAVPDSGSYNPNPVSNPEHEAPPNVIPDTLAGLPPEDRDAIEDIVAILRQGGVFKNIILGGVEAWKEARAGSQQIRTAGGTEEVKKKRREK